MTRAGSFALVSAISVSALSACGGGDATAPNGNTGGEFFIRADIDGPWESSTVVPMPVVLPGTYALSGFKLTGPNGYGLTITLYHIGAPGTYPLGVGAQVPGGSATVSTTTSSWATPLSGAAGSITIATLTSSRIAGTFNFTAAGIVGSTGTKAATNGEFNLELRPTGTIEPLPDNAGSKVSATINGDAWNAAAVSGNITGSQNTLLIASSNTVRTVTLAIDSITGPGTYTLRNTPPMRTIATGDVTSQGWSSAFGGGSGSVTITSITATRIKGTYSATLGPVPFTGATGPVTVTNGTFDLGRLF